MASASVVESGKRPPCHRGVAPPPVVARTKAVWSHSRTNSSERPANQNLSPAFMRATKLSSSVPSLARRGADDRADVQFVLQRDVPVGRAPDASDVGRDTAKAGIGCETRAAATDEI